MIDSERRSSLYVEGKDDFHAIRHLLVRRGIDYNAKCWPPSFPSIKPIDGKDKLLDGIETAVRFSNNLSVGFVLDANSSLQDRWGAIKSRLERAAMAVPDKIPATGFVGKAEEHKARVGVWLMPDNQSEGSLEHFLQTLIDEKDQLFSLAKASTEEARTRGARFADIEKIKAVIHTWLSWQENPGLPYGTAIRARYFRDVSPAANSFTAWFRDVFNIPCP